jgi:phosphocarrier protein FPr
MACLVLASGGGAHGGQLSALGNPVLAARAADLQDVGRRVLAQIDPGLGIGTLADLPSAPCILVAEDLSPPIRRCSIRQGVGIATSLGGPTSHSAILARTLGIPSVVAGGAQLLSWLRAARRSSMAMQAASGSTLRRRT